MATTSSPQTECAVHKSFAGAFISRWTSTPWAAIEGVPALLKVFAEEGVRATFFVALGPDNSGRAIFRVFRQRGFFQKMWRTRAPSVYGLKTMCYGTLLPAPRIHAAAPVIPGLIWRPATNWASMAMTTWAGTTSFPAHPRRSLPGDCPGPANVSLGRGRPNPSRPRAGSAARPAGRLCTPKVSFTPATPGA